MPNRIQTTLTDVDWAIGIVGILAGLVLAGAFLFPMF
jgi:hypothetical protein